MYPVEIINKIKMQDAEAFRELVNMYGKRMYLRLYEKSGNREIALEAVKEAFIELYVAMCWKVFFTVLLKKNRKYLCAENRSR